MTRQELRVLHIEDDSLDGEIIEDMLKDSFASTGVHVCRVESLKEALEELSKGKFDIILLDLILASTVGVNNVMAVKSQAPDTPLIVLTGVEESNTIKKSLEAGAEKYILKAYESREVLKNSICSILKEDYTENDLFKSVV